jgi:cytochrome c5
VKTRTGACGQLVLAAAALAVIGGATSAWAGAAEGKAVYEKQCKVCHSIAGEGGVLDGEAYAVAAVMPLTC